MCASDDQLGNPGATHSSAELESGNSLLPSPLEPMMTVSVTASTSENRVDAVDENVVETLPALTQSEPAALIVADKFEDGESRAMHPTLEDEASRAMHPTMVKAVKFCDEQLSIEEEDESRSCAEHSTIEDKDEVGSGAAHSTPQSVDDDDSGSCAAHSTKEDASCAVHSMLDDKTLGFNHGLGEDWISVSTDREYLIQRIVWIKEGLRNGDETWGSSSWSIPQLERRVAELTIEGDSGASAIQRLKIGEKLATAEARGSAALGQGQL